MMSVTEESRSESCVKLQVNVDSDSTVSACLKHMIILVFVWWKVRQIREKSSRTHLSNFKTKISKNFQITVHVNLGLVL